MPESPAQATVIIGDIHLDLVGLDALLAGPIGACGRIVITGDFLDRGAADPHAVLDRLLALPHATLLIGNHELVYLGGPDFAGVTEPGGWLVAPRLRGLVLDGKLRAAALVDGTVCVHGGFSRTWLAANLVRDVARDPKAVVAHANRTLLRAVARRDFSDPLFHALRHDVMGPFWASAREDLLRGGAGEFDQVVGHVPIPDGWHTTPRGGRIRGVCRERAAEGSDAAIGYCVLPGTRT